jgi:adenylate cyclase
MTATRRLAAILAADVAGYSRLMGADEEGTHERLKALRRELLDPKIAEHNVRFCSWSCACRAVRQPDPGTALI